MQSRSGREAVLSWREVALAFLSGIAVVLGVLAFTSPTRSASARPIQCAPSASAPDSASAIDRAAPPASLPDQGSDAEGDAAPAPRPRRDPSSIA